jgi:lysozyme
MIPGIDVSHYNGEIDWAQVAAGGVKFAYIKCTDGAFWVDPMYEQNVAGARAAGLKIGSYHFLRSGITSDQLSRFLDRQKAKAQAGNIDDLPPCLDVELTGSLPVQQCVSRIVDELNRVPMIYTNPDIGESLNPDELCVYPLWLADYAPEPHLPQTWDRWTFWQYTNKGTVPGINGAVDLDWFNGNQSEFEQFIETSKTLPT